MADRNIILGWVQKTGFPCVSAECPDCGEPEVAAGIDFEFTCDFTGNKFSVLGVFEHECTGRLRSCVEVDLQ